MLASGRTALQVTGGPDRQAPLRRVSYGCVYGLANNANSENRVMQPGVTARLSAVAVAVWRFGVCVRVSSCNVSVLRWWGKGEGLVFDLDSEYCLD